VEELLAQLLQQRALQTKAASDAKHGPVVAQLRAGAPVPRRPSYQPYQNKPMPGMPGNAFDPDASHTGEFEDYKGNVQGRFPRVPAPGAPPVYAGDGAHTAEGIGAPVPEYVTSADERFYRKEFGGPPERREPLDLVTDAALQRDDDVSQTGWLPADFQGKSALAAMAMIADQLRTRRIRTLGELDPEYLATQPVY
jgi:hypothetical protein